MNSKTGFLTIPRKDCHKVAAKILENTENQIKIAESLARSRHFAAATSYYITALEEFIKALVLNLDGIGFRFRNVKEFGALFLNHELRYFLSFFIFFVSIFDDDITRLCSYLTNNKGKLEEILKTMSPDKKDLFLKWAGTFLGTIGVSEYLLSKVANVKQEIEWFKQMKLTRESCIYTGYADEIQSPLDFSEDQHREYSTRICKVINVIKIVNTHILSESEFILELKKGTNNDLFYNSLNEEFKKIKDSKGNNFDSFLSGFEQFIELFSEKATTMFLELFLFEILPFILSEEVGTSNPSNNLDKKRLRNSL